MKIVTPAIVAILLFLSWPVMAKAPVMDDSESFALLEEQAQAAEELPVAQDGSYGLSEEDNEEEEITTPIAKQGNTSKNIDFVNKLQSLEQELQELRGQVEVQAHELEELKQQQVAIQNISPSQTEIQAAPKRELTPQPKPAPNITMDVQPMQEVSQTPNQTVRINPADEQISYLAAYDLVKQQQFPQAIHAMQQFLTKYPQGGYSANAHYWLGELYLANKEYSAAIEQFENVIHNFKSSSKKASSHLKLGYAFADAGRLSDAKEQFNLVMNLYPDTTTAKLAHKKLAKLGA